MTAGNGKVAAMDISSGHMKHVPAWILGLCGLAMTVAGVVLAISLRDVRVPAGIEPGPSAGFVLIWLSFLLPGLLLVINRLRNPVGWILMGIALAWQINSLAGLARIAALDAGALDPPLWAAWVWDILWIPAIALVPLLFLVFPDGRLPSRRWRWLLYLLVTAAVLQLIALGLRPGPFTNTPVTNPLGVAVIEPVADLVLSASSLGFVIAALGAAAAPIVRYRTADVIERYQLKWFLAAVIVVIVAWTVGSALQAAGVAPAVLTYVRTVPLVALPLATALAVLRHRLYDIDVVLNRGLVYASLAALIGGIYLVTVIGVGALVGLRDSGGVLPLAATAIAALAFQPARQRLQRLANLAVYGQPLSPYEVLSSFSTRMSGAYAAGDAPAAMASTVGEALPVATCDIWLRGRRHLHLAASWPTPRSGVDPVAWPDDELPDVLPGSDKVYPVRHDNRLLGAIAVSHQPGAPLLETEDRLLIDLAAAAWLVLDNAQLVSELRASRQRLVAAQDTQRRRIERDLHDGAQHRLLELALSLRLAREESKRHCNPALTGSIATAEIQLRSALGELRDLARGIHPAILTERGLPAALSSLADRAPLPVTVVADGIGRLPSTIETTVYFVAAETLSNVIKHAGASAVTISLGVSNGQLELLVTDDGSGGADPGGPGLSGVADRVAAIGGRLTVASPPGDGTMLKVVLPCV